MRLWRKLIRNYFTFNNREKHGLYVLVVLLLILSSIHLIIRLQPAPQVDLSAEQLVMLDKFEKANESGISPDNSVEISPIQTDSIKKHIGWQTFDPNFVDSQVLINSGLNEKISQRLINYRKSGGRFKSADDLSKIYGMDSSWLLEAKMHIEIEQKQNLYDSSPSYTAFKVDSFEKKPKRQIPTFELNSADSMLLVQLPWVGPYYASEIVKLRQNLGGFKSHDQLLSIYRLKDQTIESILEYTTLYTSLIVRMNINEVDIRRLGYHPFLTWKQAQIIVIYRDQHGDYQSVEEILKTRVISDSVYLKIAPYLTIKE